jgi:hypothetical protein
MHLESADRVGKRIVAICQRFGSGPSCRVQRRRAHFIYFGAEAATASHALVPVRFSGERTLDPSSSRCASSAGAEISLRGFEAPEIMRRGHEAAPPHCYHWEILRLWHQTPC